MKKILFFGLVFIFICQAGDMKNEENRMIYLGGVKVKYINFTPKKIDKACLAKKLDKLFKIIEINIRKKAHLLHLKDEYHFDKTMNISKEEVAELSNQLLQKRHVSTKGNHEWRKLVSSKHIIIENEKRHIYIMYPLEPMMFIISGISFEEIKDGNSIPVRGLKDWVDMKECIQF